MLLSQLHFVFGALHNVHEQDQIGNSIFAENTLIFVKFQIFQDVSI